MKKITTILLAIFTALLFTACGGGGDSSGGEETNPPENPIPPVSEIEGTGTIDDPYIVGNGSYSMTNTEYFSFNTSQVDCNVLIYNIENLDYAFGPYLYDNNFVEIDTQTEDDLYPLLPQGEYSLKVNTWDSDSNGDFGIFSPCVTQPNNSYELQELQEGIIEQSTSILYKVTSQEDRIITINIVEGSVEVHLYDNSLSLNDSGMLEQSYTMNLESGVNYINIKKLFSSAVKFSVSFE